MYTYRWCVHSHSQMWEKRVWRQRSASGIYLSPPRFETGWLTELGADQLARLTSSQWTPVSAQCWKHRCALLLTWALGMQTQVLMLTQQAHYILSQSPCPHSQHLFCFKTGFLWIIALTVLKLREIQACATIPPASQSACDRFMQTQNQELTITIAPSTKPSNLKTARPLLPRLTHSKKRPED